MFLKSSRHKDIDFAAHCVVTLLAVALLTSQPAFSEENSLEEANRFNTRGEELYQQRKYAEAEPLLKRALTLLEEAQGQDGIRVGVTANLLGIVYKNLRRYDEAETLSKRALAIREKNFGSDHVSVAVNLRNIGILYDDLDRTREAEPYLKRALTINEKALGVGSDEYDQSLNDLVNNYSYQGRYIEAEPLYKYALARREETFGHEDLWVALSLNGLARFYQDQARYGEAEPLFKRALAIREKALGRDHGGVAIILGNLESLYSYQGRYGEAEPLGIRALAIREKLFGPEHADVGLTLNNLGNLYMKEGRYDLAEQFLRRALVVAEKEQDSQAGKSLAITLNNLGVLLNLQGRYHDSALLHKRALEIREVMMDIVGIAQSSSNLASSFFGLGRLGDAIPLLKRAVELWEKGRGPNYPDLAITLSSLAVGLNAQGDLQGALAVSHRSVSIRMTRVDHEMTEDSNGAAGEQKLGRTAFVTHLSLLSASSPALISDPSVVSEAFSSAQYASGIETARALAGMAARFASGSDVLAGVVRERQDLQGRWKALDALQIKAASKPPEQRSAEGETEIRKDLAEVDKKLVALDERLRKEFPRFAELASAKPATLKEVQSTLAPDEALVQWTVGTDESYAFVIRKDRAVFFRVPLKGKEVAAMVAILRDSLDAKGRAFVELPPFDVAKAYELYAKLLGPAQALLDDAKRLIVVADGALQSLPPSVLVAEAPKGPIATPADYKSVAWLARRYAISVLPAVSSLISLRRFAKARHGEQPFIGFGDPDFRAGRAESTNAEAGEDQASLQPVSLFRGGVADIGALRRLPRLPETADELRAEAKALGAPASSVYLGKDATVSKVKSLDLSKARVLAFATHGLIAGELPKLAEPALALTPPQAPSETDDGLLRASEAAQLKLNADWVVLSACNTAAANGAPGAEGLSGLAKAFFYAGARSLLVSHWPVDSAATVKLTTAAFDAMKKAPQIGRAEALRRAMLAMIDDAGKSRDDAQNANPILWAPFFIVGEGGTAK